MYACGTLGTCLVELVIFLVSSRAPELQSSRATELQSYISSFYMPDPGTFCYYIASNMTFNECTDSS